MTYFGLSNSAAIVLATLTFFAAAPGQAQTVVDDDGMGDASNCDSAVAAFNTIQAAVTAASPGDTIKVCPGIYTEDVTITISLTLQGAQMGVDPNDAMWNDTRTVVANESTIRGAVNLSLQTVLVFDGFTLERTASNEGHILIGARGIAGTEPTSSFDIRNNRFIGTRSTGAVWAGIHTNFLNDTAGANPGNQFLAHQNRFQISGSSSGAGILALNNR